MREYVIRCWMTWWYWYWRNLCMDQKAVQSHWNLHAGIPVFDSPWNLQLRDHPGPIQCIWRNGRQHLALVILTESIYIVIDIVRPRDLGWLGEVDHIKPTSCRRAWHDAGCVMMCAKSIKIWTLKLGVHAEVPSRNGWNAGTATIARQGIHILILLDLAWIVCSAQDDAGSGQKPCSSRV